MISKETWTLRAQILRQLGGHCVCPCGCGDPNLRRLELHHPNGDGNKHRLNLRGVNLYKYLSKQLATAQPIDPPLILLCLNCHGELTRFGSCNGALAPEITAATEGSSIHEIRGRSEQSGVPQPSGPVSPYPHLDPAHIAAEEAARREAASTPPPVKKAWWPWR